MKDTIKVILVVLASGTLVFGGCRAVVWLVSSAEQPKKQEVRFAYYRRTGKISVDEQMRIKQMLESNGYVNVSFGWDFGDVVMADAPARTNATEGVR